MQHVMLKRLPRGKGLDLPAYATPGAAAMDLRAAAAMELFPGHRASVPTGLSMAIPQGFVGVVFSRSGLALKHGVLCVSGLIDSDYRGEVMVILANHGAAQFSVARGDRVAQLMIAPAFQAQLNEVDELTETKRGGGGFGSTGVA